MPGDLFSRARDSVLHGGRVLDIGAGIRPQTLVRADKHVCVEPFRPYADWLRERGFAVIEKKASDALKPVRQAEHIVMLDVLEHMERDEGELVLRLAKERARKQIVVFTPLGFMGQEFDVWGMGGHEWQRHRSGWTPDDFPGWEHIVDENFHEGFGAFFAIWKA